MRGIHIKKVIVEYTVPIQSEAQCQKYNAANEKLHGEGQFTPIKSTTDHMQTLMRKLYEAVEKAGSNGGWYTGDCINVEIEVEYAPEDK